MMNSSVDWDFVKRKFPDVAAKLAIAARMDREAIRKPYASVEWRDDEKMLRKWQQGKTGFPLILWVKLIGKHFIFH